MAIGFRDLYDPYVDYLTASELQRLVAYCPEIEPDLREFAEYYYYSRNGATGRQVLEVCEAIVRVLGGKIAQARLYPGLQTEVADQKIEILELQEEIAALEEEKEALAEVLDAYQRGDVGTIEDLREKYLTDDAVDASAK
jgi:hypothetical protein